MKQNEKLYQVIVAGVLLLLASMFGTNLSASDQNPCSEDIAKFCKDVGPGRALLECLEAHETQLSNVCKAYEERMGGARTESREAMRQRMRVRSACEEDVTKFCKDVQPGSGGIAACFKEHANELSNPCSDALKAARGVDEERKTR